MNDVIPADQTEPTLTIRGVEPEDYEFLQAIYTQPQAIWGTLQLPYASKAQWRQRVAEPNPSSHVLIASLDEQPVGSLGLFVKPAPRQRHVGEIGMGVHDDWAGRGVGRALMNAALTLADNWLNLRRVQLSVFVDNDAALRLYRGTGFEIEGTLADYAFRDGAFVDAYLMARFHPNLAQSTPRAAAR